MLEQYKVLWLKLYNLWKIGLGESAEADEIRDQSDLLRLTTEERAEFTEWILENKYDEY